MDTSPEYIEMCRKATMLQDNHTWEDGDYFAYGYENKDIVDVIGNSMVESTQSVGFGWFEDSKTVEYIIWLPRIDQLVELSGLTFLSFFDWVRPLTEYYDTVETACLKNYMDLIHKKRWNGEDWVLR